MINSLIIDYFEAEAAIVAKLKEVMPDVPVFTPFNITDMVESSQPSPSLHLIYAGDVVTNESAGNHERTIIGQRWLVVIAVRTAQAQMQTTEKIRKLGGPLIPKVLGALQGFEPTEWMRPMKRASNSPPAGYSSSFAYFPFMFEGRILT